MASGSGDGLRGGLPGVSPAWEKHGARREQEGCCHRAGGMSSWSQEGPGRDNVRGPGGTLLDGARREQEGRSWRSRRDGIVGPGRTRKDQKFLEKQEGHHRRDRKEQEGHSWRCRGDIAVGPGRTRSDTAGGRRGTWLRDQEGRCPRGGREGPGGTLTRLRGTGRGSPAGGSTRGHRSAGEAAAR